jgi:hypothetical protein
VDGQIDEVDDQTEMKWMVRQREGDEVDGESER